MTFGTVTVSKVCDQGKPVSVTYSVTYNANGLKASIPTNVYAQFTSNDGNPDTDTPPSVVVNGTSEPAVIEAGHATTITATIPVPQAPVDASVLPNVEMGLGTPTNQDGPLQDFKLQCSAPDPLQFNAPVVTSVSNPCLGTTSVRFSNTGGTNWLGIPFIERPFNIGNPVGIATGRTTVVNVGSALRGAESFIILGDAFNQAGTDEVISPIIEWNAPCKPGKPATSLTGVRKGTRNVLTATVKPGFGGAPVKFFRLAGTKRILVGTAKTGPAGKAVLSAPRRANTKYVAVVGATHWSVATTTVTRLVR